MNLQNTQRIIEILQTVHDKIPDDFFKELSEKTMNFWSDEHLEQVLTSGEQKKLEKHISSLNIQSWPTKRKFYQEDRVTEFIGDKHNRELFNANYIDNPLQQITSYIEYWDFDVRTDGKDDDVIQYREIARREDYIRIQSSSNIKNLTPINAINFTGNYFRDSMEAGRVSDNIMTLASQTVTLGLMALYNNLREEIYYFTEKSTREYQIKTREVIKKERKKGMFPVTSSQVKHNIEELYNEIEKIKHERKEENIQNNLYLVGEPQ